MKKSVTGPLNKDIQLINESGFIQVLTDHTSNEMSLFMGSVNQVDALKYSVDKSIPLRVLICGDLGFFAAVLGKVNMSRKWCVWCQLGPSEWSVPNHVPGEGCTIKKMHELRDNIFSNSYI